jgi:DNA-binding MarR family transcriptional regulator
MENFIGTMKSLGLSQKEAQVYLALLRTGKASASLIAENAGLKRPTTYLILAELRKKGCVLKMPGSKKQMFIAKSPEELIETAQKNMSYALGVLPQLMNMFSTHDPKVRTIHFEGLDGMREALWYRLNELKGSEVVAFFGSTEEASSDLIDLFHSWNSALASSAIELRSIVPNAKNLKKFRDKDMEYGFEPKLMSPTDYTSKTSIDITTKFVRILMFKEQQAVIIENPIVAKAMKEIFGMIWRK